MPVKITKPIQINKTALEPVPESLFDKRFGGNPDFYKCGKRNVDGIGVKIQSQSLGDLETQFGEWPHICAVVKRSKIGDEEFVAGGSLIASNVILTAAHLVE